MGALAGSGKRHHQPGLGHLQDVPERSRGTQPRAKAKQRPHAQRGGTCGATTGHPLPAAGKGARDNASRERRAEGVRCVIETTGVTPRSGRVPHPFPSTHRRRTGEERRGARGQSEKSGPIRQGMSVPRLARLRPGPGERDATTSIDRQQKTGRGAASVREEGKRGGDNRPEHEPALQPRHVSPSLSSHAEGEEGHGPPGRGPRRTEAGARRPEAYGFRSRGPDGGGGVRLRVAAEKLPGTPPAVQSPEDSVSTVTSRYKMPTLGKTWTVPGVGGLCLQITPDSRKRVAATRDPTGPHRHQKIGRAHV